jgi:hypothetical protein
VDHHLHFALEGRGQLERHGAVCAVAGHAAKLQRFAKYEGMTLLNSCIAVAMSRDR